jgi:hypothetical protein
MSMKRTPIKRYTPLRRYRSRNKFGAVAVHDTRTGQSWDSKGEHRYWGRLEMMQRAGLIADLVAHPRVVLLARDGKCREIAFKPDASYTEDGRTVWIDYKPRPQTTRETLIFELWKRFGPGLLKIVGAKGETIKTIMGGR